MLAKDDDHGSSEEVNPFMSPKKDTQQMPVFTPSHVIERMAQVALQTPAPKKTARELAKARAEMAAGSPQDNPFINSNASTPPKQASRRLFERRRPFPSSEAGPSGVNNATPPNSLGDSRLSEIGSTPKLFVPSPFSDTKLNSDDDSDDELLVDRCPSRLKITPGSVLSSKGGSLGRIDPFADDPFADDQKDEAVTPPRQITPPPKLRIPWELRSATRRRREQDSEESQRRPTAGGPWESSSDPSSTIAKTSNKPKDNKRRPRGSIGGCKPTDKDFKNDEHDAPDAGEGSSKSIGMIFGRPVCNVRRNGATTPAKRSRRQGPSDDQEPISTDNEENAEVEKKTCPKRGKRATVLVEINPAELLTWEISCKKKV
ncbi:hypothetical protein HDU87_003489 [Geranomyces variabilis]|uniref:Uncharacterized protein n=1 Tax=Geranomyces variabilis TaxID=109894 RepID=A0AAD5TJY8_9FUNG|nr:hypothetical protein HDU87_003489 [Geranomyces variabilis]